MSVRKYLLCLVPTLSIYSVSVKPQHWELLEDARYNVAVWFNIEFLPVRVPLTFSSHTTGQPLLFPPHVHRSSLVFILHFFPYSYQARFSTHPPSQLLPFPPHVHSSPSFHMPPYIRRLKQTPNHIIKCQYSYTVGFSQFRMRSKKYIIA